MGTHCLNYPVDHFNARSDFLFALAEDKTMQVFFSIVCELIWSCFALLNTAFTPNANLCAALSLHFFQAIATGPDKQTEEIDLRKFFDRDINLLGRPLRTFLLVIFNRRAEVRVVFHSSVDKPDTLIFQLLPVTDFAGIGSTAVGIIGGRR